LFGAMGNLRGLTLLLQILRNGNLNIHVLASSRTK